MNGLQILLNPLYLPGSCIKSSHFDTKVRALARKYLWDPLAMYGKKQVFWFLLLLFVACTINSEILSPCYISFNLPLDLYYPSFWCHILYLQYLLYTFNWFNNQILRVKPTIISWKMNLKYWLPAFCFYLYQEIFNPLRSSSVIIKAVLFLKSTLTYLC